MKATATFTPTTWDEKPYGGLQKPARMTKASVEFLFKGQLEGHAHTEFVMFYRMYDEKDLHAASASYVGMTRFEGTLNGKPGGFVFEEHGSFEGGAARSSSTILSGSGTGALKAIKGTATGVSTQNSSEFTLEYTL